MTDALSRIADGGVVTAVRGVEADHRIGIADALVADGIIAVEVTANARNAGRLIEEPTATVDAKELVVGAGTVLDASSG